MNQPSQTPCQTGLPRPPHRRGRLRALAVVAATLAVAAPPPATAAGPAFGFSGLFDVAPVTWSSLDSDARIALLERRADLGIALGADVLRLGPGAPDIFSEAALQGTFPWMFADRVARLFAERDVLVLVTLKQLATSSQRTAYRQHLTRVFERYDGDTDFAVDGAAVQFDHPDIDDSGTISFLDWDASPTAKQAWADARRLTTFELGDRLRAAEDDGMVGAADYAGMVGAAQQAALAADATVQLAIAGTDLDVDSRNRFLDRLTGVDTEGIAFAGGHIAERAGALDGATALTSLEGFVGWVRDAGLTETEVWLTEVSIGAAPAGSGPGPCRDARCSERTQVHGLTRTVLSALARGYTQVLYAGAIELEGSATTVGLLTAPAAAEPTLAVGDLQPRPAYAVWRLLADIVGAGPVTRLGALPTNAFGVQVPTGWVLWFDWTLEVGPGQAYDPLRRKEVVLRGVTSPAVRVTSLWPTTIGASVGTDGAVSVTWSEQVLQVAADGTVVITVAQDPVWVTLVDSTGVEDEADVVEAPGDDVAEAADDPAPPASDNGCRGAHGPAGGGLALSALAGAWLLARRRRWELATRG